MLVKKRNDLFVELIRRELFGKAVEIGVAEGGYSFYLLDCWPGVCYQVDPWKAITKEEYLDMNNISQAEQDLRYELVLNRSQKYRGRAIPVRKLSSQACLDFEDDFFDFIYIDANHKYEFIKEDLNLWWPKCKKKGIFAGHDYIDGVLTSGDYGVKRAVTEFAESNGLSVNVTLEPDYPSWWIVK